MTHLFQFAPLMVRPNYPPPTSWTFTVTSQYNSDASGYTGTQTPTAGSGGLHDNNYQNNGSFWTSAFQSNQSITADFGGLKKLTSVRLGPANAAASGSWGPDYTNTRTIDYSTDGVNWTVLVASVSGMQEDQTNTYTAGVTARYVRLRFPTEGTGYVACGEFWFT